MPYFLGKLTVSYAIRRWSGRGQLLGGAPVKSYTAGSSLTAGQYLVGLVALHLAAGVFSRMSFINRGDFLKGGYFFLFTKLVWTEGFARNDWARQAFGNVRYSPDTGQTWVQQGNQYVAMQGELVEASPLDGELVEASALDGGLSHSYGHAMSETTSPERQKISKWSGTGFQSNWPAAYSNP